MNTFLVGGAVRDRLLGQPSNDLDYVVVGSSVEEMLAEGFKQVGSFFPVFLHPSTGDEYALARTEVKESIGHQGFACCFRSDVTLEQDLERRDLTVNAMAVCQKSGGVLDMHRGMADLSNKVLRHVSDAFAEDPLRVFRTARFAATLDFQVAPETMHKMREVVVSGELETLPGERVFKEMEKALKGKNPRRFFEVLHEVGGLDHFFPELEALTQVPAGPAKYHGGANAFQHTMNALDHLAGRCHPLATMFAALCHDLGKGLTPPSEFPRHLNHEKTGVQLTKALCERLRVPKKATALALLVTEHHLRLLRFTETTKAGKFMTLFENFKAFHSDDMLCKAFAVADADSKAHKGGEGASAKLTLVLKVLEAMKSVDTKALAVGVGPEKAQEAVRAAKLEAATRFIRD